MRHVRRHFALVALGVGLLFAFGSVQAARVSKIASTKHNLSTSGTGTLKATSNTEICVFCHTPHGSTGGVVPLWNRKLSTATYTPYTSNSLDAEVISGVLGQPGGSSKLCLSCHDGTLAIGNVNVFGGQGSATTQGTIPIAMTGAGTTGTMAVGSGVTTGFTRNLGVNLTNDHPISLTYDNTLATRDGELRALDGNQKYPASTGTVIGVRSTGYKPKLPLEPTGSGGAGQIQCATCHDPHIREESATAVDFGKEKFLRLSRFQASMSTDTYSQDNDIICLACHDKNRSDTGSFGAWAYSAHANPSVASQLYSNTHADRREFPRNLPVWKASCLNCHDTHSVQGSRRLLREGTDEGVSTATAPKPGGVNKAALEETCYQCHDGGVNGTLQSVTSVPNIKTDFGLARRMPITTGDQGTSGGGGGNTSEPHDITSSFNETGGIDCTVTGPVAAKCGKDFMEPASKLGRGNLNNRHAECTDCHNPHRVIRSQNGLPGPLSSVNFSTQKAGTHQHENASGYVHSNIISGVLRGAWGVEPSYTNASFHLAGATSAALDAALTFTVKRGDPGDNTATAASSSYVTREYQICLKCHSNYGYSDDNVYPNGSSRPQLGGAGLTAADVNGHSNFSRYTNQAKEFQAPTNPNHAVPVGSVNLGFNGGAGTSNAVTATNDNNHRSWHPVLAPTGRTNRLGAFLSPWNNNADANGIAGTAGRLGVQTMNCSDCHGSATGTATVMPLLNTNTNENGSPWGPHGSDNNFLLKGVWDTTSGEGNSNTLCFKCHNSASYSGSAEGTGFRTDDSESDGHALHSNRVGSALRCNWCHVAVPHGWKNRGLLVNLNDVGPEAGLAAGTSVSGPYTNGPYYRRAFLRIRSFPSGTLWAVGNCMGGTKDSMINACDSPTN